MLAHLSRENRLHAQLKTTTGSAFSRRISNSKQKLRLKPELHCSGVVALLLWIFFKAPPLDFYN